MERRIKRNDIVYAIFTRSGYFNKQSSPRIKCKVNHLPSGPGDSYSLFRLDTEQPISVNDNSSEFIGLGFIERPGIEF